MRIRVVFFKKRNGPVDVIAGPVRAVLAPTLSGAVDGPVRADLFFARAAFVLADIGLVVRELNAEFFAGDTSRLP